MRRMAPINQWLDRVPFEWRLRGSYKRAGRARVTSGRVLGVVISTGRDRKSLAHRFAQVYLSANGGAAPKPD